MLRTGSPDSAPEREGMGAFGEPRLPDGYGGLPRFAVRRKWYKCRAKGHEFEADTNHYAPIYTCKCAHCTSGTSDCIELELRIQLKRLEEKGT